MTPELLQAKLLDPHFYLVDFSFTDRFVVFANTSRASFASTLLLSADSFEAERLNVVTFDDLFATRLPPVGAGINYLFHLPFTGSTLLTRYLAGSAVQIRDPVSLYALFASAETRPDCMETLRSTTLALLARPFPQGAIVRVAGSFPEVIAPLASAPSCARGLFLYADPASWAGQILKIPKRRLDVRAALIHRGTTDAESRMGRPVASLSDAEAIGLTWVYTVEQVVAAARLSPGRVAAADCVALFTEPERTARLAARFFELKWKRPRAAEIERLQRTHAKTGESYSRGAREREKAAIRAEYASEIESVCTAIERLDMDGALRAELQALDITDVP